MILLECLDDSISRQVESSSKSQVSPRVFLNWYVSITKGVQAEQLSAFLLDIPIFCATPHVGKWKTRSRLLWAV
jgi:hypothetical protein